MSYIKAIDSFTPEFKNLASGHKDYNPDEEVGYIKTAFQNNWKLQKAEAPAIEHLLRQIASIGLTINPLHQFAFIQDYSIDLNKNIKDKKSDWVQRPLVNIEYKGLIELLTSSGAANWVRPDVVRDGDNFHYKGPYEKPDVSVANPFGSERAAPIGAYAVAQLPDGQHFCEIMRMEELEEVKKASTGFGPWGNQFVTEMYKKSVIKRLYKTIPKNPQNRERLDTAISVSNKADGFDFDQTPESIDIEPLIKAIKDDDGFKVIGIMDGLEKEQQIEIWNSFPAKEKTKSKERARELMSESFAIIKALFAAFKDGDAAAAIEILDDGVTIEQITPKASHELILWLEEITEEQAA